MYTVHKDHLTWQQTVDHEMRDRLRYKQVNEDKYYNPKRNSQYIEDFQERKMKRFYGFHLQKYMNTI